MVTTRMVERKSGSILRDKHEGRHGCTLIRRVVVQSQPLTITWSITFPLMLHHQCMDVFEEGECDLN